MGVEEGESKPSEGQLGWHNYKNTWLTQMISVGSYGKMNLHYKFKYLQNIFGHIYM